MLEPGSAGIVLTQAANKAYRGAQLSQRAVLSVGDGAFLEYLPHHLIPFPASSCSQETAFHLAGSATLVTWDAYAAGRIARGERFAFDALRAITRVWRNGLPEATDGLDLLGGGERFGGYSYVASAYVSPRKTSRRSPRSYTIPSLVCPGRSLRPALLPPACARCGSWRWARARSTGPSTVSGASPDVS